MNKEKQKLQKYIEVLTKEGISIKKINKLISLVEDVVCKEEEDRIWYISKKQKNMEDI